MMLATVHEFSPPTCPCGVIGTMEPSQYGPDYQAHLLEQYKLYAEMADRISQRRDNSNRFYAGLVSAIIALLVVMARLGASGNDWDVALLVAGLFGGCLSVIWFINLHSYRVLNRAKYRVIHRIEAQLPYAGYKEEWDELRPPAGRAPYLQLTRVERYVPLLMFVLFVGIAAYSAYSLVYVGNAPVVTPTVPSAP